jgi:hypothetical protein
LIGVLMAAIAVIAYVAFRTVAPGRRAVNDSPGPPPRVAPPVERGEMPRAQGRTGTAPPAPRFVGETRPSSEPRKMRPMAERRVRESARKELPELARLERQAGETAARAVGVSATEQRELEKLNDEFRARRKEILDAATSLESSTAAMTGLRRETDVRVRELLGPEKGDAYLEKEVAALNELRTKPWEKGGVTIPGTRAANMNKPEERQ